MRGGVTNASLRRASNFSVATGLGSLCGGGARSFYSSKGAAGKRRAGRAEDEPRGSQSGRDVDNPLRVRIANGVTEMRRPEVRGSAGILENRLRLRAEKKETEDDADDVAAGVPIAVPSAPPPTFGRQGAAVAIMARRRLRRKWPARVLDEPSPERRRGFFRRFRGRLHVKLRLRRGSAGIRHSRNGCLHDSTVSQETAAPLIKMVAESAKSSLTAASALIR